MKGISTHLYADGRPLKTEIVKNIKCFHYSYVKSPERMKARWIMSREKGCIKSEDRFDKWMAVQWKKDEDLKKPENKKLLRAVRATDKFNIYEGNHPPVVDDHPLRHIEDSRRIE